MEPKIHLCFSLNVAAMIERSVGLGAYRSSTNYCTPIISGNHLAHENMRHQ